MLTIAHRSAGRSDSWTYDAPALAVVLAYRGATIHVPVCSDRHRRHGAFCISRLDEASWRIAPAQYVELYASILGLDLFARMVPLSREPDLSGFVALSHAPNGVADAMAEDL
jgi:hypothetical protein